MHISVPLSVVLLVKQTPALLITIGFCIDSLLIGSPETTKLLLNLTFAALSIISTRLNGIVLQPIQSVGPNSSPSLTSIRTYVTSFSLFSLTQLKPPNFSIDRFSLTVLMPTSVGIVLLGLFPVCEAMPCSSDSAPFVWESMLSPGSIIFVQPNSSIDITAIIASIAFAFIFYLIYCTKYKCLYLADHRYFPPD